MDAELNGQKAGTFGDIGTFSTFFSHHISTIEGGILTTDDSELNALARSIRNHGWTRDIPADAGIYEPTADDFYEAYRFILPGYNVRPQEMNGAVGIEQLKKLPSMTLRGVKIKAFSNRFFSRTIVSSSSAKMGYPRVFRLPLFSIRRMAQTGQR